MIVEEQTFSPRAHCMISQPGLTFVTLGTVYRHTFIVTPNPPECITYNLVQCFVRTGKRACMIHLIFYDFHYEILGLGIRISADFHITETMIYKTGSPGGTLRFTSANYIYIRAMCVAQVFREDFSICFQTFCKMKTNAVACLTFDAETYPSCQILTGIHNVFVTHFLDRNRFQRFRYFHPRHHLGTKCTRRNTDAFCRHPFCIVIICLRPVSQFFAGVIFFAVIFVIAADRTFGCQFP